MEGGGDTDFLSFTRGGGGICEGRHVENLCQIKGARET